MSPQGEISGVPVSHRDNNGVYSAVQQITELRQLDVFISTRGVPQGSILMPALLCIFMSGFGDWPIHFSSFLPSSHPLSLHFTYSTPSYPFFLFLSIFSYLPLLLPPPAFLLSSSFPNSSSFCCMPWCTNHSVCVCVKPIPSG